jgi:hypothetical protein
MHHRFAVGTAAAVLLVAVLVMPAFGAPSPLGLAQKALRTAKKADKKARGATRVARNASVLADAASGDAADANTTAAQALEAASGEGIRFVESPEVYVPPFAAEGAVAFCPSGHRVVSGGGSAITIPGLAGSFTTAERAGWGVLASNFGSSASGTVQAQALCAPNDSAVAASHSDLKRKLRRALERIRARHR